MDILRSYHFKPDLSVILPTLNECQNLAPLIQEIHNTLFNLTIRYEILVMDARSADGTLGQIGTLCQLYPVQLYSRRRPNGLRDAVLEGFRLAQGSILLVMDADGSHPVTQIPTLVSPIQNGNSDLVFGSRYCPGGSIQNWPIRRLMLSQFARFLSRGLTPLSDPTSGFFAFRKSILNQVSLRPLSWKIGLELAVRARQFKIKEIPICFQNRKLGKSKMSFKVQIHFLRHLARLYLS